MNAQHITDIKIENFRGFSSMELKGLRAINLIVGRNNAGKTSLLEAITTAASPSLLEKLPGLFRANAGSVVKQYFRWLISDGGSTAEITARIANEETQMTLSSGDLPGRPERGYKWKVEFGEYHAGWWRRDKKQLKNQIVSVQHKSPQNIVAGFADAVRSKERKQLMERLLSKVDARIKSVQLDYASDSTFISVDVGLSENIPLHQAGQGVYRLVSMFSDMLGEQPEICLIDEIENGVHHTAHKQVWRGLAEVSRTLGIQIFATTHSRECLEAAVEAFGESGDAENLAVVQLFRLKDGVQGRVLDSSMIAAGMEADIDPR